MGILEKLKSAMRSNGDLPAISRVGEIKIRKLKFAKDWDEQRNFRFLAEAIAGIVEFENKIYPIDDRRIQIGFGNNFWLQNPENSDSYILRARYWTDEQLKAVLTILEARHLA